MTSNHSSEHQPIWPKSIKDGPIQETIEKFLELADNPTHEGSIAFSELFTPDGELVARGHVCKGRNELVSFRDGAWDTITKRKHSVYKVYVSEESEGDILILGNVMFGHKDGRSIMQQFQGNFVLEKTQRKALIRSYQAWLDSKPLADLIAGP